MTRAHLQFELMFSRAKIKINGNREVNPGAPGCNIVVAKRDFELMGSPRVLKNERTNLSVNINSHSIKSLIS